MDIAQLLSAFTNEDLAEALFQASLPSAGTKAERIARLLTVATVKAPQELLDHFTAQALKGTCEVLNLKAGRKSDMIATLVALIPGAPPIPSEPAPTFLPATRDDVLRFLQTVEIPRRKVKTEADAEEVIAAALSGRFRPVANQYNLGGYLGLKIDLDIGDGKVGVEVKLADSLLKSAGEVQRAIGQAVYYDKRRYTGTAIVAVVCLPGDEHEPRLAEMAQFLASLGVTCLFLEMS